MAAVTAGTLAHVGSLAVLALADVIGTNTAPAIAAVKTLDAHFLWFMVPPFTLVLRE
jgi:hypothetical protein